MRLPSPTHLMKDIAEAAWQLTEQSWHAPDPIRALTVTALYITDSAESYEQVDLLGGVTPQRNEKQEQLEGVLDAIRDKYGKSAISFGSGGVLDEE